MTLRRTRSNGVPIRERAPSRRSTVATRGGPGCPRRWAQMVISQPSSTRAVQPVSTSAKSSRAAGVPLRRRRATA